MNREASNAGVMPFFLALIAVLGFLSVLPNDFVNWDDFGNFIDNPHYRGIGPAQLRWAFTTFHLGVYQPLGWVLFGLQYELFGLQPWGYHLVSILIHAANVMVLYLVMVELLSRKESGRIAPSRAEILGAGLATMLFAVHPLRVEVVAWASCQPYLPATFFYLLAVLLYLRRDAAEPKSLRRLVPVFGCYVCALLFKAPAITLPAVLLILDVCPLRRFGTQARAAWLEKLPFFVVAAIFIPVTLASKPHAVFGATHGLALQVALSAFSIWFHLAKLLVPYPTSAFYVVPMWVGDKVLLASVVAVVLAAVLGWIYRYRRPGLVAIAATYLVILAPTLGVVQIGEQLAADRYTYLASVGWMVGLGALLSRWAHVVAHRRKVLATGAAVTVLLAILTWTGNRTWSSSLSLWTHALAVADGAPVRRHLGITYNLLGDIPRAVDELKKSVQMDPHRPETHFDLGVAVAKLGRADEAATHYREVLRQAPTHARAHNNLGALLMAGGRRDEAAEHFRAAIVADPARADPHNNLGKLFAEAGRYDDALASFGRVLAAHPLHVEAHYNSALALFLKGQPARAVPHLEEVLRLSPANTDARDFLATVRAKLQPAR